MMSKSSEVEMFLNRNNFSIGCPCLMTHASLFPQSNVKKRKRKRRKKRKNLSVNQVSVLRSFR